MIIPEPQAQEIARQRRHEAEQAAAIQRRHGAIGADHYWQRQVGQLLIRAGERLAPTPRPRPQTRPAYHL